MSMYFYDETDDWPEYKIIKDDIRRLEMAYLETQKELLETESAFGSNPLNKDLKAEVDELRKKLKKIEKKLEESLSLYR